eukprot:GHVH01014679.1.p1 GENE.GHVH01014679.1~~GHVH01014679.1.p1  ORF type:complete len:451 (+),score=67.17 GHVH01014679.1:14-1366(+)
MSASHEEFSFWQHQAGAHLIALQSNPSLLQQDVTEILGSRVLLGSLIPSQTESTLTDHRIKNVVIAHHAVKPRDTNRNYRICKLADGYSEPILICMLVGFPILERSLSLRDGATSWDNLDAYGACFVHCTKGISRSSSVIIGYLVCRFGFTVSNAVLLLQSKRSIVFPNVSFLLQLKRLETLAQDIVDELGEVDNEKEAEAKSYRNEFLKTFKNQFNDERLPCVIPSIETILKYRFKIPFEDFMEELSERLEKGAIPMNLIMSDLKGLVGEVVEVCADRANRLVDMKFKGPQSKRERKATATQEKQFVYLSREELCSWDASDLLKQSKPWQHIGSLIQNFNVYSFSIAKLFTEQEDSNSFMKRLIEVADSLTKLKNIYSIMHIGVQRAQAVAAQMSAMVVLANKLRPESVLPVSETNNGFLSIGPSEPTLVAGEAVVNVSLEKRGLARPY